jgi:hypothetical protein
MLGIVPIEHYTSQTLVTVFSTLYIALLRPQSFWRKNSLSWHLMLICKRLTLKLSWCKGLGLINHRVSRDWLQKVNCRIGLGAEEGRTAPWIDNIFILKMIYICRYSYGVETRWLEFPADGLTTPLCAWYSPFWADDFGIGMVEEWDPIAFHDPSNLTFKAELSVHLVRTVPIKILTSLCNLASACIALLWNADRQRDSWFVSLDGFSCNLLCYYLDITSWYIAMVGVLVIGVLSYWYFTTCT